MATKIPLTSIGVTRDGKTVFPEIGKPFEFKADEVKDLDGRDPPVWRNPVNETAADDGAAARKAAAAEKKAAEEKAAAEKKAAEEEEAKRKAAGGKTDDL
jgi:membrane protein involved in colicin uptake